MYDELVKRLRTHNGWALNKTLDEAADAIEELQAAEKKYLANISALETENQHLKREREWISVTERLPEKHDWVLVCSKFVKMRTDFISNDGSWYETPGATHWMPLPQPPKEE